MTRTLPILILLLLVGTAGAQQRRDDSGCKRETISGSPEGIRVGVGNTGGQCHIATDFNTGISYRFTGTPGQTTGWIPIDGAVGSVCGDGIVNGTPTRPEQCDAPGGMGQIGSCALITDCQSNCTCSPASPCGNGVVDGGEQCDESADGSPCEGRCTSDCKCACVCGDGNKDPACATGVGETCEFYSTATASFANALDFARDPTAIGVNCTDTGECARLRDTANHNTEYQFSTAPFTVECRIRPDALSTTHRVFYKGSGSSSGYALSVNSSGRVLFETSDSSTPLTVTGATSTIDPGEEWCIAAVRSGTTGSIYVAQDCATYTLEIAGTVTATFGTTSAQRVSIGGTNTGSGAFEGIIDECRLWSAARTLADLNATIGAPLTNPATTANLVGYWKMDAVAGDTTVADSSATGFALDIVQGVQVTNVNCTASNTPATCCTGAGTGTCDAASAAGTASVVASPFSAAGAIDPANCGAPCDCTPPQICNQSSCVCQTSGTSTAATRYVDDSGGAADTNLCTTGARCATVNWVLCGNAGCNNPNRLKAGDTLILGNGTYPPVSIDCNVNANDGTQQNPITIKAESERQARLLSDGTVAPFTIKNCSWWVVEGLRGSTVDNALGTDNAHTFYDNLNQNVTFRRNIADQNNRCRNVHDFKSVGSQDSVYEENEAWNHSRHAFSCTGTARAVYRRNYVNQNGVASASADPCAPGGSPRGGSSKESFALYPCSDAIVENNIVEGSGGWGYNVEATSGDFGGVRTNDDLLIGNIAAGTQVGMKIFTRDGDLRGLFNTTVRNFLALDMTSSFGIRDAVTVQTTYDNVGVYSSDASVAAMQVDDPCATATCTAQAGCEGLTQGPASVTISDSLFCNNTGPGLNITECQDAFTRLCTLTGNQSNGNGTAQYQNMASACAGSGGDQCLCTPNPNSSAACTGWGNTGTDCLVQPISGVGPDIRCLLSNGVAVGSGAANSLWWQSGDPTPGGTATAIDATCDAGQVSSGPTLGCVGGFKGCGATVAGVNNGASTCRDFALRKLNHQPDNGGCPAATFACP